MSVQAGAAEDQSLCSNWLVCRRLHACLSAQASSNAYLGLLRTSGQPCPCLAIVPPDLVWRPAGRFPGQHPAPGRGSRGSQPYALSLTTLQARCCCQPSRKRPWPRRAPRPGRRACPTGSPSLPSAGRPGLSPEAGPVAPRQHRPAPPAARSSLPRA